MLKVLENGMWRLERLGVKVCDINFILQGSATFSGQNIQMTTVVPCFKVKVAYLCSSEPYLHHTWQPTKKAQKATCHLRSCRCWCAGLHCSQCLDHITACKIESYSPPCSWSFLLSRTIWVTSFEKNCVDAPSHSSEAAALKTWRRAGAE
jgi:hypothetical protein